MRTVDDTARIEVLLRLRNQIGMMRLSAAILGDHKPKEARTLDGWADRLRIAFEDERDNPEPQYAPAGFCPLCERPDAEILKEAG